MTMREALRDAMAEEMRRDKDVFVMGEEVAEYQGAYKVTQGLLQEFGAQARDRHADHRARLCRPRHRRGLRRPEADRRIHDLEFRHAGDGPADQFGGQDALHVGRPDGLSRSCSAGRTAPPPASPPSTARTIRPGISHVPGLKVIAPSNAADAKGLLKAAIRDPNPVIFLENEILYGHSSAGAQARRLRVADRQGAHRARRLRRDHRRLVDGHDLRAQGRRRTRQGRHRGRGDRPAHAQADGYRHASSSR